MTESPGTFPSPPGSCPWFSSFAALSAPFPVSLCPRALHCCQCLGFPHRTWRRKILCKHCCTDWLLRTFFICANLSSASPRAGPGQAREACASVPSYPPCWRARVAQHRGHHGAGPALPRRLSCILPVSSYAWPFVLPQGCTLLSNLDVSLDGDLNICVQLTAGLCGNRWWHGVLGVPKHIVRHVSEPGPSVGCQQVEACSPDRGHSSWTSNGS